MTVKINTDSDEPIFLQISRGIEQLILKGVLKEGDLLPSVREFAVNHQVNPNTVARSYQTLQQEGLVETIRGKGMKVLPSSRKDTDKRKIEIVKEQIDELANLAEKLGISNRELLKQIEKRIKK